MGGQEAVLVLAKKGDTVRVRIVRSELDARLNAAQHDRVRRLHDVAAGEHIVARLLVQQLNDTWVSAGKSTRKQSELTLITSIPQIPCAAQHLLDLLLVLLRKVRAAPQTHHRLIVLALHLRRVRVLLEQPLPGQPHGKRPIVRLQLYLKQWTCHPQAEDALREQLIGDAQLLAAERSGQHHLRRTVGGAVDLHVHGNARHQIHAGGYDL